jgi:hypothetical protein
VGFIDRAGQTDEVRLDWTISKLPAALTHPESSHDPEIAASIGLDIEGDTFRRVDRMLFTQDVVRRSRSLATQRHAARMAQQESAPSEAAEAGAAAVARTGTDLGTESLMPLVFSARAVLLNGRPHAALVRIHTFLVDDAGDFVNEFLRLITDPSMPRNGLIIDVRGNGGGLIAAAERLLQLLTPRTIEPCRVQFISTPQNLALCSSVKLVQRWAPSLGRAADTGAPYSAAFPLTPPEKCNDIGQRYYGPVVVITDARCYSATDIFAAGFRDHSVGAILGVDDNTGAGGANVWTLDQIRGYFDGAGAPSPLQALPAGSGMRVAIRRTLRVGAEAGTEIEDLGVKPDTPYRMTRDDILNSNPGLLSKAIEILSAASVFSFDLTTVLAGSTATLTLSTQGVDYVDVFVDRRARGSHDVVNDRVTFDVEAPPGSVVDLRGYRGTGELVCARRWTRG